MPYSHFRVNPWIVVRRLFILAPAMVALAVVALGEEADSFVFTAMFASVAISSLLVAIFYARMGPPNPHNVAFIGFRQSGKTTLLITMFTELLLFKVSKVSASMRGRLTIEQVTKYMKKIQLRQAVGSTTRRSQFPYEMNITQRGLFGRSFKMSFGDYPGERSEEYVVRSQSEHHAEKEGLEEDPFGRQTFYHGSDGGELFDQDFFRWILECDALIFVVDVAQYLSDKARRQAQLKSGVEVAEDNYVAEVSQAYMRTWSYVIDARREVGEAKQPVVVLAFTKSDLFDVDSQESAHESLEVMMATLGFEEPLPKVREISPAMYEEGKKRCEEDFYDVIRFLDGNSRKFSVVYTSSLASMNERRVGVEHLFRAVLPISLR